MVMLLEVERIGQEHLGGTKPVEGVAGTGVELPSGGVQSVLKEIRQIGSIEPATIPSI